MRILALLRCVLCRLVLIQTDAFDVDLMVKTLRDLREGKSVQVPIYDFCTHSRVKDNFVRMVRSSHCQWTWPFHYRAWLHVHCIVWCCMNKVDVTC